MAQEEKQFKFDTRIYREKNSPSEEGLLFASLPFFSKISKYLGIKEGDEVTISIKKK